MMTWIVEIFHQERGTKKETKTEVPFESREEAVRALEKLEADIRDVRPEDFVIMDSGRNRTSFLKQDFRRTNLYEYQTRTAFAVTRRVT